MFNWGGGWRDVTFDRRGKIQAAGQGGIEDGWIKIHAGGFRLEHRRLSPIGVAAQVEQARAGGNVELADLDGDQATRAVQCQVRVRQELLDERAH